MIVRSSRMKWERTHEAGERGFRALLAVGFLAFAWLPFVEPGFTARALHEGGAFSLPMAIAAAWCLGAFRRLRGIDGRRLLVAMIGAALASLVPITNDAPSAAILLGLIAVPLGLVLSRWRVSAELREIARRSGLEVVGGTWTRSPAARGRVHDVDVRVEQSDSGLLVTCEAPDVPKELLLTGSWSPFGRTKTGDANFDERVHLSGPLDVALERFDEGARSDGREAIEEGAELRDGIVRWRSMDARPNPPIPAMIALVRSLRDRRSLAEAAMDRVPEVRIAALEALSSHPPDERRRPLAQALDSDESPAVRRRAAELIVADSSSPDRARAEAWLRESSLALGGLSIAADEAAGKLSIAQQAGAVTIAKKT